MSFPKHHGITLANNSWIENLHVERLATDPLATAGGRIWFNVTDKVLRYTVLDSGGAVVVKTVSDFESAQAALTALQTNLDAEVNARAAAITAEANARQAADNAQTQSLNDETTARIAADSTETAARQAADAAEATARTDAIAVASATAANLVDTEASNRLAADAALGTRIDGVQAELDATQVGAGLGVSGAYVAPQNTTYLDTATTLKGADVLLDTAITAEAAARTGAVASLSSALANEAQLRTDGDANLQSQLTAYIDSAVTNNVNADNAETVARVTADSALQAELDRTQAVVGTDSDGNLIPITGTNYLDTATTVFGGAFILDHQIKLANDAIAGEVSARTTADTTLTANLNTEITNRTAADTAQQTEINTIETGAGLEGDGSYTAPTGSNYLNSAVSLKDADFKLDAALKDVQGQVTVINTTTIPDVTTALNAEVSRATTAESDEATARAAGDATNATAIAAEASRAQTQEAALTTSISNEVTARQSADNTLTTALANEVSRAQTAETGLSASISSEVTRASGVEAGLQSQIDAVVAASGDGANALKTEINNGRFNYTAVSAALVHTVTHGLNTANYLFNVLVQGTDGVYRNDIVPVEEIDANGFRVTLTEARIIKVSVMNMAAL